MTPDDLRAWAKRLGYSYDQAAEALGIHRSTWADLVAGQSRTTGKSIVIDKRTALACAAIEAGIRVA